MKRQPDRYWLGIYRRTEADSAAFRAGLMAFFGIPTRSAGKYMCPASLLLRKVRLDICALDEWLGAQGTGYTTDGCMRDEVAKNYGDEAVAFVLRFISGAK